MRSMWKGSISFGLVTIPVKLYTATEQKDITFRQVHREDGGRIRFRRVCSLDGEEVPYEDIAKGFELPSGEIVVLTDDDMADLPLPTLRSIEVLYFAPETDIDPILLSRSYFVEPENSGARAYVLLRDAMERSGKVAVVQVALRQRESLAALRSRDGVLVLETLLWPDEVRVPDFGFLDQDINVRTQELKMAASLIDTMTEDFDPSAFKDAYREALEALVQAKIEGNEVVRPAGGFSSEKPGGPADLTETLRASVAAAKANRAKDDKEASGAKRAIRAGIDSIEHGSFLDEEALDMMKQRGTYYVPTLMAAQGLKERLTDGYLPPAVASKARQAMAALDETVRKAIAKGVRIAVGTDATVYPHGRNTEEFHLLVDLGMKPVAALKAGTSVDAELLGIADRVGTLEVGKLADIVACPGNPVENIRQVEKIGFVMKEGVVVRSSR